MGLSPYKRVMFFEVDVKISYLNMYVPQPSYVYFPRRLTAYVPCVIGPVYVVN